jgi:hypothetical protein
MFNFNKPRRPVTKVYIHCSASDNPDHDNVATMDDWHKQRGWNGVGYHLFCRKSGQGELGRSLEKSPAAQGGHNRGTIAICLHGLVEDQFTKEQLDWLIDVCCQIDEAYGGNVTFHGHREVANKECPVINYKEILQLDEHGNLGVRRNTLRAHMVPNRNLEVLESADANPSGHPVLRMGSHGRYVRYLQLELKALGYHAGKADKDFGKMTRAAVLAFQADNFLNEDGVVGDATYEALEDAEAREIGAERASMSVAGLAVDGSRIAQASMAQGALGSLLTAGGAVTVLEESTGIVTQIAKSIGVYEGVLGSLGPWIGAAVVVGGILVVLQAKKAGQARRDDGRTGKTL